jgi:hypothetical protein
MEMSDMTLGEFNDFAGLHLILRARAEALQLSRHSLDEIAGLPSGLAGKILSPHPKKRFGNISLPLLLAALGMKLVAEVDEQKTAALQARIRGSTRNESHVRNDVVHIEYSRRHFQRMGKRGGPNSRAYMSPRQASALGKRAAQARWSSR